LGVGVGDADAGCSYSSEYERYCSIWNIFTPFCITRDTTFITPDADQEGVYLYEGLKTHYLLLLQRIPGSSRTWDGQPHKTPARWRVYCTLCETEKIMQIRDPPQLSCGCVRTRKFRAIHLAREQARLALQLAYTKMDVHWT
jgi:hypothetical protein